jgi:hypothetical protein
METIELGTAIEDSIARFSSNRIGDKPPVFVTIPTRLRTVPWRDRTLKELVRVFLYEILLTSDPDATLEVSLRRRTELRDLDRIVEANPSYWVQLRIAGRGLKMFEKLAQELCYDVGYRCEEWLTVQDTTVRLATFAAFDRPHVKIILCLESSKYVHKCDLLFPVVEAPVAPSWSGDDYGNSNIT